MFQPGVHQRLRRATLLAAGLALLGWLGLLLSDLYRSRQELARLRQEEQVRSAGQRAQALGYVLSERLAELGALAEDRTIRTFYENRALGMSMAYGLGASLHAVRHAFREVQEKRRHDGAHAYRRLAYLDGGGEVLADVAPPGAPGGAAEWRPAAWAPLLGGADEPPRLAVREGDLVISVPYLFRPSQGGHLLAWLPLEGVLRRAVGQEDPATRLTSLLWEGRPARRAEAWPPGLQAELLEAGARLADGGRARLEPSGGGPAWLAVRSDVAGTPLALLTLVPEAAAGPASPELLVLLAGGLGLLLVAGVLASALEQRRALRGLEQLLEALPFAVAVVSQGRAVALANAEARRLLAGPGADLVGRDWREVAPDGPAPRGAAPQEVTVAGAGGARRTLLLAEVPAQVGGEPFLVEAFVDLTERRQLEAQLRQSQKLEAVGQLAAGVAHELNTPIQFVGDSVRFLQEGFGALVGLVGEYRRALAGLAGRPGQAEAVAGLAEAEEAADLAYLQENGPPAFARTLDGLARVAGIVGAMKAFAHPDQRQKQLADLNRALATTLTIARHEYKYVADVETDLGDLPPVRCHVGALNQAFLNLIVNAAHAIAERIGPGGGRGRIRVRSRHAAGRVRVEVEDDGCGIPEAIRERVFDPFFTTKEVGRGTGQGLAIARAIVVDRHGGVLGFESEVGRGTTFHLELPVEPAEGAPAPLAAGAAATSRT